jgi:assimilatory nitrate reductase catalytic subunit
MKRVTRGQPCDITGIDDYAMIDDRRGIQWPLPEGQDVAVQAERRLFEDGRFFHPDGRARLLFESPRPLPEPTDERYPLILLSGRGSSSQWHTQTRTSKSAVLRKLYPEEAYVEVNPEDARRYGLSPSDYAIVESRRGKMRARVNVTHVVQPGQVFVPMHYADANQLTFAAFDPYSRQPSYKHCAVQIHKSDPFAD